MPLDTPPSQPTDPSEIRHGTTVSVDGVGLLIVGPSGAGKSALALTLMAFGAELVADDRTRLCVTGRPARVWAEAPPGLPHLIEARGVGLLPARCRGPVPLVAVADLGCVATSRLPERRFTCILGQNVALFHGAENAHFPYAILQHLRHSARTGEPHEQ